MLDTWTHRHTPNTRQICVRYAMWRIVDHIVSQRLRTRFEHGLTQIDCYDHGLKCRKYRPKYRRYFVYRLPTKRFLKSFAGKIVKNRQISPIYRRNIGIWAIFRSKFRHVGDTRAGKILWHFLGDISPIYRKYRRYIGDIFDISVNISAAFLCG